MANFVFLIGHPGSGKSSLYAEVEQQLMRQGQSSLRVNDRDFFFQAMRMDTTGEFHTFFPDGSHEVTDGLFELQFRLLREALLENEWIEEWVFVEMTSSNYPLAIRSLGMDLLEEGKLVLLLASLERVLQRNNQRVEGAASQDDAKIPEHYIQKCYRQEFDLQELPAYFKSSLVLQNDGDDPAALKEMASRVVEYLGS